MSREASDRSPVRTARISRRAALGGLGGGVAIALLEGASVPAPAGAAQAPQLLRAPQPGRAALRVVTPAPRCKHTATVLPDGRLLVAGGYGSNVLASVQIYNPASGLWTAAAPMNVPREQHAAALLPDGRVLVAGGYSAHPLASAEIYDPLRDTWVRAAPMTRARYGHTAALLGDGRVMVVGGYDRIPLSNSECYSPGGDAWEVFA